MEGICTDATDDVLSMHPELDSPALRTALATSIETYVFASVFEKIYPTVRRLLFQLLSRELQSK